MKQHQFHFVCLFAYNGCWQSSDLMIGVIITYCYTFQQCWNKKLSIKEILNITILFSPPLCTNLRNPEMLQNHGFVTCIICFIFYQLSWCSVHVIEHVCCSMTLCVWIKARILVIVSCCCYLLHVFCSTTFLLKFFVWVILLLCSLYSSHVLEGDNLFRQIPVCNILFKQPQNSTCPLLIKF